MILISDSGSTKTDWVVLDVAADVKPQVLRTQGLNPIHMTERQMEQILRAELLPQLGDKASKIDAVYFYGAGVRADMEAKMEGVLRSAIFNSTPDDKKVMACSDLLGAARALCGKTEGIACILGTGANSCLYDGVSIVANTPAMGYVLGDEGSGAVLGRLFLNALFKGRLTAEMREEFCAWANTSLSDVIDRVYRQPMANRWLASLAPFIHEHLADEQVRRLVVGNFVAFFHNNVDAYERKDLAVSAIGSIAWHFRECLEEAAQTCGYRVGKVLKTPIDGLAAYHLETLKG
ncbi:MAG: ATPase [Prevotella sp.]|nr:ATPase [Prevotella sp.]